MTKLDYSWQLGKDHREREREMRAERKSSCALGTHLCPGVWDKPTHFLSLDQGALVHHPVLLLFFFFSPLPIFPQFLFLCLVSPLSASRSFISAGLCDYVTGKGVVHTLFCICWSLCACGRWICCTPYHVLHSFKMLCQVKNSSPYDSHTADQCPF